MDNNIGSLQIFDTGTFTCGEIITDTTNGKIEIILRHQNWQEEKTSITKGNAAGILEYIDIHESTPAKVKLFNESLRIDILDHVVRITIKSKYSYLCCMMETNKLKTILMKHIKYQESLTRIQAIVYR